MKRLVIFDLDGTLLNTIADLAAATNHALKSCGFMPHAPEIYPHLVGNGITKLIERALPDDNRDTQTIEAVRRKFLEYYDVHCTDLTSPYEGMHELLRRLNSEGVAVAVASNKYHSAVVKLIGHFFPDVEWADVEGHHEDVPSKPDPSIVFEILSKCPTAKADVLYVGDSAVDMETARRACVESVGVTWGFRGRDELTAAHADNIVDTPAEILRLVMRDYPA